MNDLITNEWLRNNGFEEDIDTFRKSLDDFNIILIRYIGNTKGCAWTIEVIDKSTGDAIACGDLQTISSFIFFLLSLNIIPGVHYDCKMC